MRQTAHALAGEKSENCSYPRKYRQKADAPHIVVNRVRCSKMKIQKAHPV